MSLRILALAGTASLTMLFTGCESLPQNIDMRNDHKAHAVMGLDYRDFQRTANVLVQSLLGSGRLRKSDGTPYIMTCGKVLNDTMQRIDTDQLMAKIEESLLNSGQVIMTSAIAADGGDDMVYKVRELRNLDEFNQATIPQKGQLVAPELSISGKIIERQVAYGRGKTQVEYYFQLEVARIGTGLMLWKKEEVIGKRGSSKSVTW